ncbi:hypothetical protein ACFQVA_01785 [Actinomadura keratinilytica]
MTTVRERLKALSIELPDLGPPRYAYEATSRWGDVLYVSGQISRTASGEVLRGRWERTPHRPTGCSPHAPPR